MEKLNFPANNYPIALTDRCMKSFLDKIYNCKDKVHTCS